MLDEPEELAALQRLVTLFIAESERDEFERALAEHLRSRASTVPALAKTVWQGACAGFDGSPAYSRQASSIVVEGTVRR